MQIVLIRHSLAQESDGLTPDSERRLTNLGEGRADKLASALLRMGLAPVAINTSPYLRALETAQIIARQSPKCTLTQIAELSADLDLFQSLQPVTQVEIPGWIYFIGHQPQLSILAHNLIGSARELFSVSPATALALQVDGWRRGGARLVGLVSGEFL